MQLLEFLKSHDVHYTPILDGSYERFPWRKENNQSGYLTGHEYHVVIGDWSTGERYEWFKDTSTESPERQKEIAQEIKLKQEERQKEKEAGYLQAAKRAAQIWKSAKPCTTHAYLAKKKVLSYGLKQDSDSLIIPVYISGKLSSLQFITTQDKSFLPKGKLKGGYYPMGKEGASIYLCEGYATGASILEILGPENAQVIVCFTAGNLPRVAEYITSKNLNTPVYVCADNDHKTNPNPGLVKACEAQNILSDAGIPSDVFYPKDIQGTDWNDFVSEKSVEEARNIFAQMLAKKSTPHESQFQEQQPKKSEPKGEEKIPPLEGAKGNAIDIASPKILGNTPVEISVSKNPYEKLLTPLKLWVTDSKGVKKLRKPTHEEVAHAMLEFLGVENYITQDKSVFKWVNTHWKIQDEIRFQNSCVQMAFRLGGLHSPTYEWAVSCYKTLLSYLPTPPENTNIFKQPLNCCNFLDGTLWLDQFHKKLEFKAHSKLDYLTGVLPREYKSRGGENPLFKEWLDRAFEGDSKKEEKLRALAQLGGSCLIPVNPISGFLYGKAGSGKSTFAGLCYNFIGEENLSTVSPEEFNEPRAVEVMINKRVNINTDLGSKKIDGGMLKRLTDKKGILVQRIYQKAVIATLPAVHLFCSNELPDGLDGVSDAMDRRVCMVKFEKPLAMVEMTLDYDQVLINAGQGAILDFFVRGLEDLVQRGGRYVNPGAEELKIWKKNNDPMGDFLDCCAEGEIDNVAVGRGLFIKQNLLYEKYLEWAGKRKMRIFTRHKFYFRVREIFPSKIYDGYDVFHGIGVLGTELKDF